MIQHFKNLTQKANKTHIHPDADGIGSEIALCMALRTLGKEAYCVNEEELLDRYKYLDPDDVLCGYESFTKAHPDFEPDLFIVTDTNSLHRIGIKIQAVVEKSKDLLFIDHHPCPKEVAAIHCIDTNMAATGELVGKLIESIDVKFTKEIALALYTSILIDTSSFRYPTVTANTHLLISKLMDTGIEPPDAYNKIYGTKQISYMKLLGIVLSSADSAGKGRIGWMKLTEKDMDAFDVDSEDTHGFVNHLLILDNIKVAMMFREIGTKVKISMRSAGDIDVGIMAQALGGGGHDHSAATIIDGAIDEVIEETIPKIQLMLEEDSDHS